MKSKKKGEIKEIPPSSSLEPMKREKGSSPPSLPSGSEEFHGSEFKVSNFWSESIRRLFFELRLAFFLSGDSDAIITTAKAGGEEQRGLTMSFGRVLSRAQSIRLVLAHDV